jgi:histidinol phosphatase-like PHP family hydrolase
MLYGMIDLHTHTILSDGELVPAEHIRRAEVCGYRVLGLADHVDLATMDAVIPALVEAAKRENALGRMLVLPGAELTHVRPKHIAEGVARARSLGARFVIVHGETISEPVEPGTNRSAILAAADILAHPGLITPDDAALAAQHGVMLEISAKRGHCLCNGHVVLAAADAKAKLIYGSDAHGPGEMHMRGMAEQVCLGAGLSRDLVGEVFAQAEAMAMAKSR